MTRSRRLALATLIVKDYDEAIAFFVGKLGFACIEDRKEAAKRWVVVAPSGEGAGLVLGKAATLEQERMIGRQTAGRVAFFLHTDDFRRDYALYVARGVKFVRPPVVEDYGTVAVFEDLYGNLWDLIGP